MFRFVWTEITVLTTNSPTWVFFVAVFADIMLAEMSIVKTASGVLGLLEENCYKL